MNSTKPCSSHLMFPMSLWSVPNDQQHVKSQLFISTIFALIILVTGQISCDPGTFIRGNRCRRCRRGEFQPLANQTSCEFCPPGTVATSPGNTECGECPENSMPVQFGTRCVCEDGRAVRRRRCELCKPGTVFRRDFNDRSFCNPCESNTFQPEAGQSECLPCPRGSSSLIGATECITCGEDEFLAENGRCATCPPGRTILFSDVCEACAMDTFKAESGIGPCLPCPVDMFSLRGSVECQSCPTNSTLVASGRCISCPPGSRLERFGGRCRRCPNNTFMPYRNSASECFLCREPNFSLRGASECTRCPRNTALLRDGTCAECEPGTIYNRRAFRCDACAVNTFTRGEMRFCQRCPRGSFASTGSSTCFSCPRGQAYMAATDSCGTCPPGMEYLFDRARCRRCSFRLYKPDEGIEPCEFCPSERSNPARTACL